MKIEWLSLIIFIAFFTSCEKLADEYPGTRCELTTLIYGECSCGFCDGEEDDD